MEALVAALRLHIRFPSVEYKHWFDHNVRFCCSEEKSLD